MVLTTQAALDAIQEVARAPIGKWDTDVVRLRAIGRLVDRALADAGFDR